jgi:hypothetical protein
MADESGLNCGRQLESREREMSKDEFEDDDPMELVGMVMPGEPGMLETMAETIVDEYVRLGWDEERLMTLFVNPMFMATYRIYRQKGEPYVRHLIREVLARWGVVIR